MRSHLSARHARGHWTAGRIVLPAPSPDAAKATWVFDVVLDGEGRLLAVTRSRPARGVQPSLARVIDRAIIHPLVGRPHLPLGVRVESARLAHELAAVPLPLEVTVGPTPVISSLLPRLSMLIPTEEAWSWLEPECDRGALERLFDQILDLSSTFAWYTLTGQEAIRVELPCRGEVMHLRLEARESLDRRLRLAVHVAPDEATLEAWRLGETGPNQITIREVLREELSQEAYIERLALDRPDAAIFPRVTVGPDRRAPTRTQWQIAARAMMAFNALHDPLESDGNTLVERMLDDGEVVHIEVLGLEFTAFPENDGALDGMGDTAEGREDERFLDAYVSGAFDLPERGRTSLLA